MESTGSTNRSAAYAQFCLNSPTLCKVVKPNQLTVVNPQTAHGRHRKPVNRASTERATKGRKRAYADWLGDFYRSQLRGMRRQNHRAKPGGGTRQDG